MNKTYRSIYNESLGAWVAVSEITTARGKRNQSSVVDAVQPHTSTRSTRKGGFTASIISTALIPMIGILSLLSVPESVLAACTFSTTGHGSSNVTVTASGTDNNASCMQALTASVVSGNLHFYSVKGPPLSH